ncbi:MAG: 3-phosphoserine/phosphohydroxythreonine transaminase [Betaproteobacteria bacterium]|nr:MAG: 3-phosphoserine/phosphohydroxythreonine transaminase [Betaproteobacteria bacterium]
MSRVFNFSAGPAALPEEVLEQARDEMLDWHGAGMSVMEMSHRGKEFISIAEAAEADLRELLGVTDNYKVLFLQGGATSQFSMVPQNLLADKQSADYVYTGQWSKKAIAEAKKFCRVNIAASSEDRNFTYIPRFGTWRRDPASAYVHITSNETIGGVEYHWVPDVGDVPLVADMSSHLLSRPVDVSRYGLIYAGAQKNIGPAGLTIVIIKEDLIGTAAAEIATMADYKTHAESGSMYNTPPTYAIYVAGLVLQWLKRLGGLAAMEKTNIAKSQLLYEYLDSTQFYDCPVSPEDRSRMNVPFRIKEDSLDAQFLAEAKNHGLVQLKGHRSVGGMRASIYNAMPIEGVRTLVEFMREFERNHG